MSKEANIDGNVYQIGTIDTIKQYHVARRLAPFFSAILEASKNLKSDSDAASVFFQPVAEAMARMSDDDSNYILSTCLNVVTRDQNGRWMSIKPKNVDRMQFDDIRLPQMLQLTWAVIEENLGDFFLLLNAKDSQGVKPA